MPKTRNDSRHSNHLVFNRMGDDGVMRAFVGLPMSEGYLKYATRHKLDGLRPNFILRAKWHDVQPVAKK